MDVALTETSIYFDTSRLLGILKSKTWFDLENAERYWPINLFRSLLWSLFCYEQGSYEKKKKSDFTVAKQVKRTTSG